MTKKIKHAENDNNKKAKLEHLENLLSKANISNIRLTEEKNKIKLELNTLHQTFRDLFEKHDGILKEKNKNNNIDSEMFLRYKQYINNDNEL